MNETQLISTIASELVSSQNSLDAQWISAYATIFVGIVTLFAVIVALFGESFIDWLRKPKIEVILSNNEPFVVKSQNFFHKEMRYFRIKIKNRGKTLAKNCRLRLIVAHPEGGQNAITDPANLKWSSAPLDSRYLIESSLPNQKTSDLHPIFREYIDIPPFNGWELCDLFLVREDSDILFLCSNASRHLKKGNINYLVWINIFGENFKPQKFCFQIINNEDFNKIKIKKI